MSGNGGEDETRSFAGWIRRRRREEEITEQHHSDETLSAFIDGDIEPEQAERVGQHLESCPLCRETVAELTAIRDTARGLEQLEPSAQTWYRIKRRVERRTGLIWRWSLAGAAAVAAVAVAVVVVKSHTAARPDAHVAATYLSREAAAAILAAEHEAYIRGIDEAIEECEAAMAENPRNMRVRTVYLAALSSRASAMDLFGAGGN